MGKAHGGRLQSDAPETKEAQLGATGGMLTTLVSVSDTCVLGGADAIFLASWFFSSWAGSRTDRPMLRK